MATGDGCFNKQQHGKKMTEEKEKWKCLLCQKVQTVCGYCEECLDKMIPLDNEMCPNDGCSESLKSEQLKSHLEQCLQEGKEECNFTQFGCEFVGTIRALQKHHAEFISQHLEMITVYVGSMDLENTAIKSQLKNTLDENNFLVKKIEELSNENKATLEIGREIKLKLANKQDQLTTMFSLLSKLNIEVNKHSRSLTMLQNSQPFLNCGENLTVVQPRVSEHEEELQIELETLQEQVENINLRFLHLETSTYDGILLWKISSYMKWKADTMAGNCVHSQPFYSKRYGYKMCGCVFFNGYAQGKGTHISVFICLMKGEYDALLDWPFKHKVTLMILDQEDSRNNLVRSFKADPNSTSCFNQPTSERNPPIGFPLFTQQSHIEKPDSKFIKNDTMFVKIIVDCGS